MKRSGRLNRYTQLRSATGLARKALTPTRRKPAVPDKVRAMLWHRSSGICEIGLDGCTRWADDPSHRKGSKAGGRKGAAKVLHDSLANVLAACRPCHIEITSAAEPRLSEYRHTGLLLEEWQDPAEVPVTSPALVWLYGGPVWLTDTGPVLLVPADRFNDEEGA